MNRASALTEIDRKAAIADYTRVIELQPKNADAYALRGTIHLSLGRKADALADLQKAVQLDPTLKLEYEKYFREALRK